MEPHALDRQSVDPAPDPSAPPIWLFDGFCVLCSGSVRFMLRHEREPRLRFVAVQSPLGRQLAARHGVDADNPETFLFLHKGQALAKSQGVVASLRLLRAPWSLLRFPLLLLPRALADLAYQLVAKNRYRLMGRRSTCFLPSPPQRSRFVLPEEAV